MLRITLLTHTSEIKSRRYCGERLIIFLFIKEFIHPKVSLIHIFMRHVIFVPSNCRKIAQGLHYTSDFSRYKTSNHQFATFEVSRKTMSPTFLQSRNPIHHFVLGSCTNVWMESVGFFWVSRLWVNLIYVTS